MYIKTDEQQEPTSTNIYQRVPLKSGSDPAASFRAIGNQRHPNLSIHGGRLYIFKGSSRPQNVQAIQL